MRVILALFCSISSLWAAEAIKDGFVNEYDKDGRLVRIVEYKLGVPNGLFRTFYPDGRISGTGKFLNGVMDDVALGFWPDGTMKIKSFYTDGRLHGTSTLYYNNGRVQAEVEYIKGMQDGPTREYNEQGHLKWERHFKAGKEVGTTKEFDASTAALYREYEFNAEGKQTGFIREYWGNGTLKGTYTAIDGIRQGPAKEFYQTGKISKQGGFINDEWDGEVVSFYENGQKLSVVRYKNGKKNDPAWQQFYETGELKSQVKVVDDLKQGVGKEFFTNKKVKTVGEFKDNKRQGIFKEFDEDGKKVAEFEFKDDVIRYQREYAPDGRVTNELIFYHPPKESTSTKNISSPGR